MKSWEAQDRTPKAPPVRAARLDYVARVRAKIATVERLYLDELMKTRDAVEGIEAFIAKRPAQWMHR